MWGKIIILALLVSPAWAARRHAEPDPLAGTVLTAQVEYVKDGDTVVIKLPEGGEQDVRLVDINTPEGPHNGAAAEPFAEAARARVKALALGKTVKIEVARKGHDKYGRILGNVYLPDGIWLNELMVREGFAHVYTFADDAMHPDELLKTEQAARAAKKGIWSVPRWQVKEAATCCAPEFIGIFQIVQGKVLSAGQGKKEVYLNFGRDYHTDFTVVIEKKNLHAFAEAGIDPLQAYAGKTVRVHGFTDPVEGVEMRVTHPAQIEIVP